MKCPIDGTNLVIAERSGVEIDYCPQCRGVWLDRGELDKIVERNSSYASPAPQRQRDDRDYDDRSYKRKKRGGFLEDLFDF
ncbi:MAG: zf-TFIIB domain-containing protein [Paracoccaceae bacterium]